MTSRTLIKLEKVGIHSEELMKKLNSNKKGILIQLGFGRNFHPINTLSILHCNHQESSEQIFSNVLGVLL